MHAFFGADVPEETVIEENASLGAQFDYGTYLATQAIITQQEQDAAKAQAAFYGVEVSAPANLVKQLGEPIPGYSGCNRRIQADNVFGMTYAEARKMAGESMSKINQEKRETLKETSQWKGASAYAQ